MYMLGTLNLLAKFILHNSFHLPAGRRIDTVTSSPPRLDLLHNLMNGFVDVSCRITRHPQKRMLPDFIRRLLLRALVPLLQLPDKPGFGRRGEKSYRCGRA